MKSRHLPFFALALVVWLYFVASFAIHPASSIKAGRFIDPDNSMYLVETLDWLHGQGWYDRVEHRLNPPEGVPIHFSRLMELPYAAVIAPLQSRLGDVDAAIVSAAVIPPLFFFALFYALRFQTRFFMPWKYGGLVIVTALFAQNMAFVFMPGQAGHHGLIVLLITLAVSGASMMLVKPGEKRWAVITGFTLAFALSVALECLPWVLLISAFLGFSTVRRGEMMAKAGGIFGLTLAASGLILLTTYKPPSAWFDMDLVSYSSVYVLLLIGIALCFGAAYLTRRLPLKGRMATTLLIAIFVGGAFLAAFPELITGPYGAVDERLKYFMLPNISEAIPMIKRAGWVDLLTYLLPWPLLALGVCAWRVKISSPRRRPLWLMLMLLQTAALLMTLFYQSRFASYTQLFGIIPITCLMQWGLRRTPKRYLKPLWIALPGALMVGLPGIVYDDPLGTLLLFPMQSYLSGCDMKEATAVLSKPPYYTGTPRLIFNTIDEGPEILLRTPHSVVSGPYHENVSGNLAAAAFFRSNDLDKAEAYAHDRGVDYVFLCRDIEAPYLISPKDMPDYTSGYIPMPLPAPLAYQLITLHPPKWLAPVNLKDSDILLYRVVP